MPETKMQYAKFFTRAIPLLKEAYKAEQIAKGKTPKDYKGIHSVFSGFNTMAREYYGKDFNVVEVTNQLSKDKIIVTIPAKGGCTMYLPQDAPASLPKDMSSVLAKVLG